jgi:hypothetical protein
LTRPLFFFFSCGGRFSPWVQLLTAHGAVRDFHRTPICGIPSRNARIMATGFAGDFVCFFAQGRCPSRAPSKTQGAKIVAFPAFRPLH